MDEVSHHQIQEFLSVKMHRLPNGHILFEVMAKGRLSYIRKTILHNGILVFKNQKRTIKVGDSPSLS